jgi:hypothetical protein
VHQDLIGRQAVQPGGEGGIPTEASNLFEEGEKGVLRQVFGVRAVARHPQGYGVNEPAVTAVQFLESFRVACASAPGKLYVRLVVSVCCLHLPVTSFKDSTEDKGAGGVAAYPERYISRVYLKFGRNFGAELNRAVLFDYAAPIFFFSISSKGLVSRSLKEPP